MGFFQLFQLFHVVYLLLERICLRRLRSPLLHHCCNAFSALLCFHFTAFFAFDFFATNLFCLRPLKWHIQVSLLSSSLLFIYEAFLFFFFVAKFYFILFCNVFDYIPLFLSCTDFVDDGFASVYFRFLSEYRSESWCVFSLALAKSFILFL